MIRHIVMWNLKEEAEGSSKEDNAQKMKLMLEGLKTSIEQLKRVEVGINIKEDDDDANDVVLIADFESDVDLTIYDRDPNHQRAKEFIQSVAKSRNFVDYEVEL